MADPAPSTRRTGRVALLILLFVLLLGGLTLAGLSLREVNASAKQITVGGSAGSAPPQYALSTAQQAALEVYGPPDAFTILFYRDEAAADTREETWSWFEAGHEATFTDGELAGEAALPPSGGVFAAPYRPEQFTAYMSLDEVLAAAALAEYIVVPLEEELVPGGDSFFADQLTFGLKDGALLYLEAIAFEDLDAAAPAPAEQAPASADVPAPAEQTPATADVQPTTATAAPAAELPAAPIVFASERGDPNFPACRNSNDRCSTDLFVLELDTGAVRALTADDGYDAYPAWSPDGDRVVFSSKQNGNWDIYVINADSSGRLRLTTDDAIDAAPSWSPDGTQIVFHSTRTKRSNLYIINADGTGLRQLTDDPGIDRAPAWSPDGSQIAFFSSRDDSNPSACDNAMGCNFNLYTIHPDGSGLRRLTDTPEAEQWPAWSPDGTQIAYGIGSDGGDQVFVIDADGGNADAVTPAGMVAWIADWSPDGEWIIFAGGETWFTDVIALRLSDGEMVTLSSHDARDLEPDW